jgi:hypothetical protein
MPLSFRQSSRVMLSSVQFSDGVYTQSSSSALMCGKNPFKVSPEKFTRTKFLGKNLLRSLLESPGNLLKILPVKSPKFKMNLLIIQNNSPLSQQTLGIRRLRVTSIQQATSDHELLMKFLK